MNSNLILPTFSGKSYWLIKTEPGAWSWENQVTQQVTSWDGVRNYQASNNMKAMVLGDLCFFYHSIHEKRIVGVVEVVKLYHPDPSDPKGRFGMVDVKAVCSLVTPVTLEQIKSNDRLSNLGLIRQSRLSVMPVDEKSWNIICQMGGLK